MCVRQRCLYGHFSDSWFNVRHSAVDSRMLVGFGDDHVYGKDVTSVQKKRREWREYHRKSHHIDRTLTLTAWTDRPARDEPPV
jgi:hypothetical protein